MSENHTMTRKEYFKTHDLSNLAEPLKDELELLRNIRNAARLWRLRRNPAECLELAQALDKYYEGQYGQ